MINDFKSLRGRLNLPLLMALVLVVHWAWAPMAIQAQVLQRVANTSLAMPPVPPRFGFQLEDAFPGITFTYPIAIASPPGETNRIFVAEQTGRIYVITNLAAPTKTLFLDVSDRVTGGVPSAEQGLQSFTFHPGFATNGYIYVLYCSEENAGQGFGFYNRLSRFELDPGNSNAAIAATELPLFAMRDDSPWHNINDVEFGPDGFLYVAAGDEGLANDVLDNATRITQDLFAGILRIDVDKRPGSIAPNPHPGVTTNYLVPVDNPWVGATNFLGQPVNPNEVRTEFYAMGLRNPWRIAFDPLTGQLLTGDVGQGAREEVNLVEKGGHYGWPFREGNIAGPKPPPPSGLNAIEPLVSINHGTGEFNGSSVTGGQVYRGTKLTQIYGAYVFADYVNGNVWQLQYSGTNVTSWTRIAQDSGLVDVGADPSDGDLLFADIVEGKIKRLTYTGSPIGTPLPPTLAQTGVFTNLLTLTPHAGIVGYQLNLPFWSDNALKSRWFSVPNVAQKITYSPEGNWSFPTGTVWIKHFDMEMTNGLPQSRRRLETRLLVKNTNGVYGVTYKWDASQTNATLVPETGLTEDLVIDDGGGILRTQRWLYPSRAECLACHTEVGGHALGFSTRQLNRLNTYPGGTTNQILALSQAGYFTGAVTNLDTSLVLSHPTNQSFSVEHRFRSYLQANCANCHQPGGPGRGTWDARIATPFDLADIVNGLLTEDFGNSTNRLIKAGSPVHSVILKRISENTSIRMPPVGSSVLDTNGINITRQFIQSLVRVMPLGDSITQADNAHNSYRRPLWQMLTNSGFSVDFVGSQTLHNGGPAPNPDFDLDHEGHWGWRADEVLAQIDGWASNAQPTHVLMHLGSNDAIQNQSAETTTNELSQIIDRLRLANSNVVVLVAKLIPTTLSQNTNITALNALIPALVATKHTTASPVLLVDQSSGFDAALDTYDGVHPNAAGEQKLAQRWFDALTDQVLKGNNQPPTVSLFSPESGATFIIPWAVPLRATALDADGFVTKVEFFAGTNKVGEATSAPYDFTWADAPAGSHVLTAKATDNNGAVTTSAPVTVVVSGYPPFFQPVNLNGNSVTVEGHAWKSDSQARIEGMGFGNTVPFNDTYGFILNPVPDADTLTMLRSGYFRTVGSNGQGFRVTQAVTNGTYHMWFYTIENFSSGYRDMNVVMEGIQVATAVGSLPLGFWKKYGPYTATVADGELTMDFLRATKGDPLITGIVIADASGVSIINTAPTISTTGNQVINEDGVLGPLPFTIGDNETAPNQLFLSASSSSPSLIPNGNITFGGSGSNRTVTITPAANASGSANISIVVTDPYGGRATNAFNVTVAPVEDPPIVAITAPNDGLVLGTPANINIQMTAGDAEGALATVELFRGTTLLATRTNAPFAYTITNAAVGDYELIAVATDAAGLKATSAVVNVTVNLTPPYLRGINLAGDAVAIEGQNWLSYSAALSQGLNVANATAANGGYNFSLVPSTDTDTRTMLEGRLYRLNPPNGQGFTLTQSITNGTYEIYLWVVEDFVDNYRAMNVRIEGTQVATNIGDLPRGQWAKYGPYTASVTDGVLTMEFLKGSKGDPLVCGVLIQTSSLSGSNTPPVLSLISNQNILEDTSTGVLPFTVVDAETPASQIQLTALSSNPALVPTNQIVFGGSSSNRNVTVTPVANGSGVATVSIVAADTHGGRTTNAFQLTVQAINDPPTVAISNPLNNATYTVPAAIPIQILATDPEAVAEVQVFGDGALLATLTNAPFSLTWSNSVLGAHTIQAVVRDSGNLLATSTVVNVSLTTVPTYFRGINLFNGAVVIEGQNWIGQSTAETQGLTITDATMANGGYSFAITPTVDNDMRNMLEGRLYRLNPPAGQGFTLAQTITNGTYDVFLWTIEDFQNNYRAMNVLLEGTQVATNIGDLPRGQWAKYGPYRVTVNDGVLNMAFVKGSKGDPLLCGLAIVSAPPPNVPPTVAIATPTNNTLVVHGSEMLLTANAVDADGAIANVKFYSAATLLGTGAGTNYAFLWTNAPLGNAILTAVATDNLGLSSTSTPITVAFVLVPQLSITIDSGGNALLQLSGETNRAYRIDSSTNLWDWTMVQWGTATNGQMNWSHTNSTVAPSRFYRAVPLP